MSESEESSGDELDVRALHRFAKVSVATAPSSKPASASKGPSNTQLRKQQKAESQRKADKVNATKASERLLQFSKSSLSAADAKGYVRTTTAAPKVEARDYDVQFVQALKDLESDDGEVAARAMQSLSEVASGTSNSELGIAARVALAKECSSRLLLRDAIGYYHQVLQSSPDPATLQAVSKELQTAYESIGLARAPQQELDVMPVNWDEVDKELEAALLNNDLSALESRIFTHPTSVTHHQHPKSGVTALHIACGKNQLHWVNQLVAHGANWQTQDNRGMNSLAWAMRFMEDGDTVLATSLIKSHGAVVDKALYELIQSWPPVTQARVDAFMQTML
ncbi:hypothetical protein BASA81_013747 [Batrachochytrium salamandrivorans]|nr:hypothetical protein BASA81_013747 [Batrachochytrium salamandrivorans]